MGQGSPNTSNRRTGDFLLGNHPASPSRGKVAMAMPRILMLLPLAMALNHPFAWAESSPPGPLETRSTPVAESQPREAGALYLQICPSVMGQIA
jgi:hypothetical protein